MAASATGRAKNTGRITKIVNAKPTQLFKAIYDPKRQEAGAYLIDNTADAQPQKITVAELEKITGIVVFPSVNKQVKAKGMNLPNPKVRKRKGGR